METQRLLYSKKEAAFLMSLSVRTIENLIQSKLLVALKAGRRTLIPARALEQFARRGAA
jgi:excisionase family DNA binding protein